MKGLTSYLFGVAGAIFLAVIIGLVAPKLISARSDEMFVIGLIILILTPVVVYGLYRRWSATKEGRRITKRGRQVAKRVMPLFLLAVVLAGCSKVPAGNVGVVVNLYGSEKGVSEREIGVGKYWLGWNEDLYLFPTFTQNDTWQKGASGSKDESITFQTGKDGMVLNADFGITFRVDPTRVAKLFQTYRKGVDEISDIYLRNLVRDSINSRAADLSADDAYGRKKNDLVDAVEADVRSAVADKGIIVEKVYLVGDIRLPPQVRAALDLKNAAFQQTLQREQEVAKAKAEADIAVATARGVSESVLINAKAQAESNRILSASLTPELVRYRSIDKWNGELPRLNGGGALPFIDVTAESKRQ